MKLITVMLAIYASGWIALAHAEAEHAHEHKASSGNIEHQSEDHHEGHASADKHVQLAPGLAQQMNITIAVAAPGIIAETVKGYAALSLDPQLQRHISARFAGVVESVTVSVGDWVEAGQTLATVQVNDSLRSYKVTAPIAGRVIERLANPGEYVGETALLTIADDRRLLISLPIFAQDAQRIQVGQQIRLGSDDKQARTPIHAMIPAEANPGWRAFATLDNANRQWSPGSWVDVAVELAQVSVSVRIDNRALIEIDGQQHVFVQEGNAYEARSLELGRRDNSFTEVLEGITAGDTYVIENAYWLKADLEKSGAAHEH